MEDFTCQACGDDDASQHLYLDCLEADYCAPETPVGLTVNTPADPWDLGRVRAEFLTAQETLRATMRSLCRGPVHVFIPLPPTSQTFRPQPPGLLWCPACRRTSEGELVPRG